MNEKIAVVGLGYVGLPLAVEFGKLFTTIGFDINSVRIAELQNGSDKTLETTSEELQQATMLKFTDQTKELAECNIFIDHAPTPTDEANRPDLTPLLRARETVGKVSKQVGNDIYESTVYHEVSEEECVPMLEKLSAPKFIVYLSNRCSQTFDYYFQKVSHHQHY